MQCILGFFPAQYFALLRFWLDNLSRVRSINGCGQSGYAFRRFKVGKLFR